MYENSLNVNKIFNSKSLFDSNTNNFFDNNKSIERKFKNSKKEISISI